MQPPRIVVLIVDDSRDQQVGVELRSILEGVDYQVYLKTSSNPELASDSETRADLIISISPASKNNAIKLLTALNERGCGSPVLPVLTRENLNELREKLPGLTNDFLVTPLRSTEVLARVQEILSRSALGQQTMETSELARLIGEDAKFVEIKRKLPLAARQQAPVLLTGETGTGKELCAHAIHYLSPRAGKPFLPINCGAVPLELFESELFGHKKGAFTGAWAAQTGLVEEAEGGTLFLDEIESLSLVAQVKLLRFIEHHTYYSVGSAKPRHADVRIIAATNLDLWERIRQGAFRADLYFRLTVMNLNLPPLRERRADIPLLVNYFWLRHANGGATRERRLSPQAMEALCNYTWPGNIRELENVVQQLVVFSDTETVETADLPIAIPVSVRPTFNLSFREARSQVLANFEKTYLEQLLQSNHGNLTRAAKEAKKDRRTFSRLVKKYHLGRFQ